ncbi:MAG: GAF domain-containing protein [Sphingomonas sp.]|uniref:GAF domain-containing protein n=1 Tax=Sphingomonas sp. TaxID=28214 RepID=UPI001ACD4203|nr:GAF domain-containing protein [Sphingomonas sp.]MBN8807565.1 GAF domain-containing protein [Sphingomonas sp.]
MRAATERLADARSLEDILEVLRSSARSIVRADGVTVVRREGEMVHYVGEDAIAPLWTGQRFPLRSCVSEVAMIDRAMVVIPDIRVDARVPLNAYLSTFVTGMAVAPIGHGEPVAAVGAYWRARHAIDEDALALLDMLAKAAGAQLERIAAEREAGRHGPRDAA